MAHLPFFGKGSIGVYANASVDVFTAFLLTEKFVKVSATLRIDAPMVGSANATIDVTPQISNDSINWEDTTPVFTQVTPGSSFPVTETKLISTVARFMRFKFTLADAGSGIVAATLSLLGDGKITSDETLESEYSFFSPAAFRESLFISVPPSPLLAPQLILFDATDSSGIPAFYPLKLVVKRVPLDFYIALLAAGVVVAALLA